jgi:shikimate dehydrogenase
MRTFGLIGFPLSHSFSVRYFEEKFSKENIRDAQYLNFPIESIEDFPALIKEQNLSGLNVTIPYKQQVIEYLDELDSIAEEIGAVNLIKFENGKRKGYNTDVHGFRESLKNLIGKQKPKALIIGTGGSSKAVSYALKELGIKFNFVSRRKTSEVFTFSDLNQEIISEHLLIINTTPLGMFPNESDCAPIPYPFISPAHFLFDLVYNPAETLFLKNGKAQGASVKNGYEMLVLQAEENWRIWNS